MKRTLSILLTIAMIISLIPAVFAADVPTMSTTVDKTEVQPGDTITLTLSIDKTITNLNNWEWAIYFDKTAYVKTSGELEPGCMSGTGTTGAVGDNVDILGKNAIRVSGLSTTGDPVTLNAGKIATVTFTRNIPLPVCFAAGRVWSRTMCGRWNYTQPLHSRISPMPLTS